MTASVYLIAVDEVVIRPLCPTSNAIAKTRSNRLASISMWILRNSQIVRLQSVFYGNWHAKLAASSMLPMPLYFAT
jgi:hypothetical protein